MADSCNDIPEEPTSSLAATECPIKEFRLSERFVDTHVLFQVVDIGRQLIVWIGSFEEMKLDNLYVTGLNFEKGLPSVTALMPGGPSCGAETLAQRIATKMKKPVMCSLNLSTADQTLLRAVEKKLFEFLASLELNPAQ